MHRFLREQPVFPGGRNHAVILPMLGKKLRSITAGTRYGRRLRPQYVERRAGGEVVHVEVAPGVVIAVAAWMLDPAACAGMDLGTPRVTLSALVELHQLLVEHDFRRSSPDGPMTIREERDENPAETGAASDSPAPAQHSVRSRKATRDDPGRAPDLACQAD